MSTHACWPPAIYSASDVDHSLAAGGLSPAAASGSRNHVASLRAKSAVDEEHFRLLTGFNDIFVSIAIVLLLVVVAQIGSDIARWLGGVAVFAVAIRWELSARDRVTRRADVAFWLHLAAAPMIAHSTFQLLGMFSGAIGLGTAFAVLAFYVVVALVALAVDRRTLLVSSVAYVLSTPCTR